MNKKKSMLLISILLIMNTFFVVFSFEFSPVRAVLDCDELDNGNYLVVEGMSASLLSKFTVGHISYSRVLILNKFGMPLWVYDNINDPLGFAHEALYMNNSNTVLIVDTNNDRVIEVAINNKSIVWEWNARDFNWTKYLPASKQNNYIQNPTPHDWTHINDIDYIPNRNSLLLSLRNFDMIIEVAHNSTKNVLWYFGQTGNYLLLNHQHNPEILSNGNILVADSGNNRIVEINYTTKSEIWSWNNHGNLRWPRDCDYISSGKYKGCYLITDSINNRILILNPITEKIEFYFSTHLVIPYEADYIPKEDSFLVGNSFNTQIIKFNSDGMITFALGIPIIELIMIVNFSLIIVYYSYKLYKNLREGNKISDKKSIEYSIYIAVFWIFILLYNYLFSVLFEVIIFPIMEMGPLTYF
ncbi:MAG: aryl-sulfate sulfotransferase [Candidatus Helarchaeota archaeon]